MSKDQVLVIPVEVDEVALSVVGYEVANFQARLKAKDYRHVGDNIWYDLAASAEVRHHPDDWEHKYTRDSKYLPDLVWQLRSRTLGHISAYDRVGSFKAKELRAPKMVSAKMDSFKAKKPLDPNDVYVLVTAFDWGWPDDPRPSMAWKDVPLEIVDYTTLTGLSTMVVDSSARLNDADREELVITLRCVHPIGTPEELMAAAADHSDWSVELDEPFERQDEFEVHSPEGHVQIFDDTGFLLATRETDEGYITIDEGGVVPTRTPTSVNVITVRLDDLAGTPARVLVRYQDPVD